LAVVAAALVACGHSNAPPPPGGSVRVTKSGPADGAVLVSSGASCGPGCAFVETLVAVGRRITLEARTTNGSNVLFRAWSGVKCLGAAGQSSRSCEIVVDQTVAANAEFVVQTHNTVFVSSASFLPNLGSARAYDTECSKLASAAGINNAAGDAFVAWVGDANSSPVTLLSAARGFVRLDGAPIADRISDLGSGRVWNAIGLDENGSALPLHGPPNQTFGMVWTGIQGNASVNALQTCTNWTGVADHGPLAGNAWGGPGAFTQQAGIGGVVCSSGAPGEQILCFEKDRALVLSPGASAGKLIYLSPNYPVPTLGGLQAANAFCTSRAPAGHTGVFKALVATLASGAASNAGVQRAMAYVRPDGVVIGTGEEVATGNWRSGAWQFADGTYPTQYVLAWGGAARPDAPAASAAEACHDWTDPSSTGRVGYSNTVDTPFDLEIPPKALPRLQACSAGASFYCVEQ
jgi:hypothetical protein